MVAQRVLRSVLLVLALAIAIIPVTTREAGGVGCEDCQYNGPTASCVGNGNFDGCEVFLRCSPSGDYCWEYCRFQNNCWWV